MKTYLEIRAYKADLRKTFPNLSKQERDDLYAIQQARSSLLAGSRRRMATDGAEEGFLLLEAWSKLGKVAQIIMDRNEARTI